MLTHWKHSILERPGANTPQESVGAFIPMAAMADPPYWGETPIIRDPCYKSQRAAAYQNSQNWEALRHTSMITIGSRSGYPICSNTYIA